MLWLRAMTEWSFLTNHARAWSASPTTPGAPRDIATTVGITERSAYAIVTDLTAAGYVVKDKDTDGRRNRYQIQTHLPLPENIGREQTIGEVLDVLVDTNPQARLNTAGPGRRHTRRPRTPNPTLVEADGDHTRHGRAPRSRLIPRRPTSRSRTTRPPTGHRNGQQGPGTEARHPATNSLVNDHDRLLAPDAVFDDVLAGAGQIRHHLLRHAARGERGTDEPVCGSYLPACRDTHGDHLAELIHRRVDVAKDTANLHIGLVNEPAAASGVPAGSGSVDHELGEVLHPSVQAEVIHLDAAFRQQLLEVTVGQAEAARYQRTANRITPGGNRLPANDAGLRCSGGQDRRRFIPAALAAREAIDGRRGGDPAKTSRELPSNGSRCPASSPFTRHGDPTVAWPAVRAGVRRRLTQPRVRTAKVTAKQGSDAPQAVCGRRRAARRRRSGSTTPAWCPARRSSGRRRSPRSRPAPSGPGRGSGWPAGAARRSPSRRAGRRRGGRTPSRAGRGTPRSCRG